MKTSAWCLLAWSVVAAAGCQDRGTNAGDAGQERTTYEGGVRPEGGPTPLVLEFTMTGCARFDLASNRCTGSAPLRISFAPLSSASLNRLVWDFGDGTPMTTDRSPVHTYSLPGMYNVTLVAEAAEGTLSRSHLIEVGAAALGGHCDVDAQCAPGLGCVCGSTTSCHPAFSSGVCAVGCQEGLCNGGAVCADLSVSAREDPTAALDPWRRRLCLAPCRTDADCVTGLRCRDLPSYAPSAPVSWRRACFVAFPLEVGSPCRAPGGQLTGSSCTTGSCLDLGALGSCSQSCSGAVGCPVGTACAQLGDGRSLCLRDCASPADCAHDPLLACEPPGSGGRLGFTVSPGTPAGGTYCAPRRCTTAGQCGAGGDCAAAGGGSHCVRL
jgi:PKD repeat protein